MRFDRIKVGGLIACLFWAAILRSQQPGIVPRLIKFSGELAPAAAQGAATKEGEAGKNPLPTVVAATFSLYELQEGGSPLWSESQKVQLDGQGRYTVLLGAPESEGLPLDLFTSGKALWLGVQPQWPGAAEQPRILLVAVPYALKAADSDTLGGKPASAYALAEPVAIGANGALAGVATTAGWSGGSSGASPASSGAAQVRSQITGDVAGKIPKPQNAGCSTVTDDGVAATPQVALYSASCALTEDPNFVDVNGQVGIGTANPSAPLNVVGNVGSATTNQFALLAATNWTPSAAASSYIVAGANFQALKFGASNVTNGIARVRAVQGLAVNEGSGSVSGMTALLGGVENLGAGTVTNGIGLVLQPPVASAGSPLTNSYGIYINGQAVTGVTNGYGIYSAGASDINSFAGSVGIGTAVPAAKLEVNGTAKFDGNVTVTGLTAGDCVQAGTGGLLTTTGSACGSGGGGGGTITGVTAGTGLSGGGTNGTVTLGINAAVVPELSTANSFSATQTISSGNLNLPNTTGASSGVISMGGIPFFHNCCNNGGYTNIFVGGMAGNLTTTGAGNTGIGYGALYSNTTGQKNAASGNNALNNNIAGSYNTADGSGALNNNNAGSNNTAIGSEGLAFNTSGTENTAVGYWAGYGPFAGDIPTTGSQCTFVGAYANASVDGLTNATAIGYQAEVGANNSLILGGAVARGATVNVGIGVLAPTDALVINNTIGTNILSGQQNGTIKFRVDSTGKGFFDGGTQTGGADFAESVAVRGKLSEYEPGDLLVIERGAHRRLTLSSKPYSTLVAGIYSTKPGVLATPHNMDNKQIEQEVPLAVVGIVPCKVTAENGAIQEGDLLVASSRPGYAMKGTDRSRMLGAVVGKALEPLAEGTGVIQVLVTLQ